MTAHRRKAYVYLLLVTIIWGLASSVIKFTLEGIDPGPFLVYRFGLSTVLAFIFLAGMKNVRKIFSNKHFPALVVYSFFSTTLALGALFWGLDRISVLESNVVSSIIPLLIVVAGAIVFKERVSHQEKVGALLAFLGTCIALVLPILEGVGDQTHWVGTLLILGYMVSDIVSSLMAKGLLKKNIAPSVMTNFSFIIGFVTIVPFVFVQTPSQEVLSAIVELPLKYHLGVWYMALMSGTLAYYLRNVAQKSVAVGEAGLFTYLIPVFSAPVAILWLGEKFTLPLLTGAVLIITGVVIAEMKGKARKRFHFHVPHLLHHK